MANESSHPKPAAHANACCGCCSRCVPDRRNIISRHKGKIIAVVLAFVFIVLPIFSIVGFFGAVGEEVEKQEQEKLVISGSGEDKIAVLNIDGVIVEKDPLSAFGFSEEITSARRIKRTLREIENDDKVKAVLLRINSPGGSAAASEEIYKEIRDFKKRSNIKVVAYFSDIAASGGFYVAMASDYIVANPSNITGSIGVIISYLNFQEIASKYGVKNIVYKSGQYKDIINEFREPTESEKAIMQSLIADSYDNFVQVIKEGRHLPENRVIELGDGRVYSARQAQEAKLIDELGTLEDALKVTRDKAGLKEATAVEFGQPGFWDVFLGATASKFNMNLLPKSATSYFDSTNSMNLLYLYTP